MKNRGFTLIELLIYAAIVGSISVFTAGFLWNIIWGGVKESSYLEVQQNARLSLLKMEREIKKASGIVSPLPGQNGDTLVLEMANPDLNPVIFDTNQGTLRISQGSGSPVEITSDDVRVDNISFSNLSYPDTPGVISVEMGISRINPENKNEYRAQINLETSISLFPGGAAP